MKPKEIKIPCPCGGIVELRTEKVIQDGIDCGMLKVELCSKCGTKYLSEESMLVVEEKLRKAGLWGMDRKEVKFWKTGSAVTIRLPTCLVRKLNLEKVEKGYLHPEGDRKIVIEI